MIRSWKEMNMGTYLKFYKMGRMGYSTEDYIFRVAALLGGISYDELLDLPLSKTREYVDNIEFVKAPIPEGSVRPTYTLGDKKYKLCLSCDKMTTAQYIDFQGYAPKYEDNLIELLAVLFVPEGHTYGDGYEKNEVERDIRDYLSVVDGLGIAGFFFSLFLRSMKSSLRYLDRMRRKMERKAKVEEERKVAEALKEAEEMMGQMLTDLQ